MCNRASTSRISSTSSFKITLGASQSNDVTRIFPPSSRLTAKVPSRLGEHVSRLGRVMVYNLSEEICECYRHAEDCALKAIAHTKPQLKQDFLDLEQR